MSEHTPGPWLAIPSVPEEGSECFWLQSSSGAQVGSINGPQNDEQTANAALIAAAPELLAALEGRIKLMDEMRAMGRPPYPDYWGQSLHESEQFMRGALAKAKS